jgi:hypothetical protein
VVEDLVEHLRTKHDIDLADAEDILSGDYDETTGLWDRLDEEANLIVTRMREAVDIEDLGDDTPGVGLAKQRGPRPWD